MLLAMLVLLAGEGPFRQRLLHALRRLHLGPLMTYFEDLIQAVGRLGALRKSSMQLRLCAISIAIWLLAGLVNHLGFRAVHLDLPFAAGLLLAVTEIVGTEVAYAPAGVGVYHSICILTLSLFGVGFEPALSAAILLYLVVYVPILAGGLASLWIEGLGLRGLVPS